MNQQQSKSFADINEHQLDRECTLQPRLMLEWRDKLAEANKDVLEAKANLEAVEADWKGRVKRREAQLQLDIRKAPSAFGLPDKLTEKLVESAVMVDRVYVDLQAQMHVAVAQADKELREKKELAEHLDGAVEVLRQRKAMLEKLVDLALSGHYANLRPPAQPQQAADQMFKPQRSRQ